MLSSPYPTAPAKLRVMLDALAAPLIAEHGQVINRAIEQSLSMDVVVLSARFEDGKVVSRTIPLADFYKEPFNGD